MINIKEIQTATAGVCQDINAFLPDLSSKPRQITLEQLEEMVRAEHTRLFMAYDPENNCPVGMYTLAAYRIPTGWRVWLEDVVVSSVYQGKGYGSILVEHAVLQAQGLFPGGTLMLTSRPSRLVANHIYSSLFGKKETNVYEKHL